MTPRLSNAAMLAPRSLQAMMALEASFKHGTLEPALMELVRMRASQINHCAFCLHMHASEALAAGENEMRLYLLEAWRESSLYTPRERAALGWTEALTLLPQTGAPDADYEALAACFEPEEQVQLTLLIGAINSWNRLQVGFRAAHPVEGRNDAA